MNKLDNNNQSTLDKKSKIKIKFEKEIRNNESKIKKLKRKLNELYLQQRNGKTVSIKKLVAVSNKEFKLEIKNKRLRKNIELLSSNEYVIPGFFENIKIKFSNIENKKQRYIWGYVFLIPWIIGMLMFFLPSFFTTIFWSFNDLSVKGGVVTSRFVGIANFKRLFTGYVVEGGRIFSVETIQFMKDLVIDLPIIIIFSIIISVLLNKKFKGHLIIKALFFIPVVFNMSVVSTTLTGSFGQFVEESLKGETTFVEGITTFLLQIGIGESIMGIVVDAVSRIFTIVNLSGIQILLFVAAIQSVPKHLYEAAAVEGATTYESFWKITIPMITPMIITAAVYTVVDSFTRAPISKFLVSAVNEGSHGLAAAVSVTYFVINIVLIGIVFLLFKGRVFYYDEE